MREAILSVFLGAILNYDTQTDESLGGSLRALMDEDEDFKTDMDRLIRKHLRIDL